MFYRQTFERDTLGKKGKAVYQPTAMVGWERVHEDSGVGRDFKERKGYKWVLRNKNGDVVRFLWEFEIGDMPEKTSIEKRLLEVSWAKETHEKVKQEWLTL